MSSLYRKWKCSLFENWSDWLDINYYFKVAFPLYLKLFPASSIHVVKVKKKSPYLYYNSMCHPSVSYSDFHFYYSWYIFVPLCFSPLNRAPADSWITMFQSGCQTKSCFVSSLEAEIWWWPKAWHREPGRDGQVWPSTETTQSLCFYGNTRAAICSVQNVDMKTAFVCLCPAIIAH